MAEGNETYNGLAVPLYGESEIQQQTAATDILSLTGATSQSGDFLVCQNSSGTERFVVEDGGNIAITSGLAADVLIKATQAATPTGDAIQVNNSSASKVFQVDSSGGIATMVLATKAIAAIASNASTSFSMAGLTTDSAVVLIPLKALTTGLGHAMGYAQGTTRVDVYAVGGSVASNTYAVWAFKTAAN